MNPILSKRKVKQRVLIEDQVSRQQIESIKQNSLTVLSRVSKFSKLRRMKALNRVGYFARNKTP